MIKKPTPPRFFLRFFQWFCNPKLHHYIEGDLLELYEERIHKKGKRYANVKFILDVLLLFRPGIIKPSNPYNLNFYPMYKNYLITSWRNLLRSKGFSLINIAGLSLGITCSIFIALWVNDEYQVDSFHEKIDQLYVVTSCEFSGDERNGGYDTPGRLHEELKKVIPEVQLASGYAWTTWFTFAAGDKKVKLPGNWADEDFFQMFSYPLIAGSKTGGLETGEGIAISRKMATLLFGSPDAAMNQTVLFENYQELKVTAVFEDLGDHVYDKFDYIINWELFLKRNQWLEDWNNSGTSTFVMLDKQANPHTVALKIKEFIKGYDPQYSEIEHLELGLQPFDEMYLESNFENGYVSGGRIEYVRLFSFVAIFILMIACINFMNLSTARSINRSKEIGLRKTIGAQRVSLIGQFLIESFLYTGIAVIFSLIIISALLPQFNLLTEKNIALPFSSIPFLVGLGILVIVTSLLAGSYPAFLLSSFKPLSVLKGLKIGNSLGGHLRKGLVIFQFSLSIIFIVGMLIISKQVDFIFNKNLGYQKENLIYLPVTGAIAEKFDVFKNEALKLPGIRNVSHMSYRPFLIENGTGGVEWDGKDLNTRPTFTQAEVGYDFISTMESSLIAGRDFSKDYNDKTSFLINETALKVLGYKDPIGKPLSLWDIKGSIIGVIKDFHFNSIHVPIDPLILRLNDGNMWGSALIRIESGKTASVLANLETLHKKLNPEFPFSHQFADEEYAYLYKSEQVVNELSRYFAFIAIFISCLGLLGLIIFMSEQRVKEIGVRKVLGASVYQIVSLLSSDFIKLIFLSTIIAMPLTYFIMEKWLLEFEYRIEMEWWMFGLGGIGAFVIALATISFQAIKSAVANPVDSLRHE